MKLNQPHCAHLVFVRLGLAIALLTLSIRAYGQGGPPATFFVAPSGNDMNAGTQAAPFRTLAAAQAAVREANGTATNDITVYLAGGLYRLTNSLVFTAADSGQNGHRIIYQALPGQAPVLDGGMLATNWTLRDPAKNIWQATVPAGVDFRQFYVNGVKANLTRSVDALGLVPTPTGYTSTNAFLQSLSASPSVTNMEIVARPLPWQQEILPVAAITTNGGVTIQAACWSIVGTNSAITYTNPVWLQNAYELLANPGDWYLQRASNTVNYIPRAGDNMATTVGEAPVLEQLLVLAGTSNNPVSNLRFQGISFQMTTWRLLGPGYGLPQLQANQPQAGWTNWNVKAAMDGSWMRNVDVSQCGFGNLGGNGVNVLKGSKNAAIDHCQFAYLSGSAIQVGLGWSPDAMVATGSPEIIEGVVVANNTIHDVCTDYPSGCGIYAGYTRNCAIVHNTLYNLPYTGISLGWGWAGYNNAFTSGNWIDGNLVHDHLRVLADGGAVYCNGIQLHATLAHNYAYNQNNVYGVLYLDDGSSDWLVFDNVALKGGAQEWYLYKGSNNHAYDNFADNAFVLDGTTGPLPSTCSGNTIVTNGNWPSAAQAIMSAAGPEAMVHYSSWPGSFLISKTNGNGGFSQGLTGWTVIASQGGVGTGSYPDANTPPGSNEVYFNGGDVGPGIMLEHAFNAQAGHVYALSYSQATMAAPNDQTLAVSVIEPTNTNTLGASTTWVSGLYARFGYTFAAKNSGTDTLCFTDETTAANSISSDGSLDNVELRDVTPPPPVLNGVLAGNSLLLSWPAAYIGWQLQIQTNALNVGLQTGATNWQVWPGSDTTNQVTIPIFPANPVFFMRLACTNAR